MAAPDPRNAARKKVVYVHHAAGIGGAPLSLLYLLEKLPRDRFIPKVLFLHDSEVVRLFAERGIETAVVDRRWMDYSHTELVWHRLARADRILRAHLAWIVTALSQAPRVLARERPDLVHLNSTTLSAWAHAAHRLGVPVVLHVREPLAKGYLGLRRRWLRRQLRRDVDRFVAISRHDAQALDLPEKTEVIHNFVDFNRFDRGIAPAPRPASGKVVLYLGGDAAVKGYAVLLAAIPRLGAGTTVWLAGHYARPPRQPGVHHLGVVADVERWIAASDLVVFPSTVPHFARPVIEAQAMAKPVIASAVAGMDELVEDGVDGLLVPPSDPLALAAAIDRVLADPALAARLGETGHRRARVRYDAEVNAARTFAIYDSLWRAS